MNERRNNNYHSVGACGGDSYPGRGMGREPANARQVPGGGGPAAGGDERQARGGQEPRAGKRAQGFGHTYGEYSPAAQSRNNQLTQ